ncbi:MAG: hypothetical protein K9L30_16610 [Desulfobacterales bacterium]|nr:hypothetical protein [Desulfobacterales bacterium]
MKKQRHLIQPVGVSIVAILFLITGTSALGTVTTSETQTTSRADVITIDIMTTFGKLERPPVTFLHDKHTDALKKMNKDCRSCHLTEKDKLLPKFKRTEDTDKQFVMDVYHNNCVACHKDTLAQGEPSGPINKCADCHKKNPETMSSRQPVGFDKSLHFRHSKAADKKCETCHHAYDKETKKLFYDKGKEGTCRYCHRDETEENRMSMSLAAHSSCIPCHTKTIAENKNAGPVQCAGCHDLENQKKIKKVEDVPRMDRKQPDTVIIRTGEEALDAPQTARMDFVPFDHKTHETKNNNCRVCHHEEMTTCNKCHTIKGDDKGGQVRLSQAMHKSKTAQSCVGCHEIMQQQKDCAGCHTMAARNAKMDQAACKTCHMAPADKTVGTSAEADAAMAAALLAERTVSGTYDLKDIPEKIAIKDLSDKYEAADFPHRKIVETLADNISDNKLATFFHTEKGTLCQGCHHNSPAAIKPPKCGSCHGEPFDEADMFKPGLVGAYHQQCMSCHENMGMTKPVGCTECHKKKES